MVERWLPERACPWLAALLILVAAAWRVMFLLGGSLDLSPDEAHYWDWSRNLDWSYYSKGPLVAWVIWASCGLLGPLSESLTGQLTFAVRAPAVLFGSLLLTSLYVLTIQVSRNHRLALGVVAAALTHPVITAGSSLMTIDSPYACAWGWALVLALHAVRTDSLGAWLSTGLLVGLGILAKYTMVLFLPSLALFLLISREHRRRLLTAGPWAMVGVASLMCVPILIWNAQHDWVTVRHVLQLAGLGPKTHTPGRGLTPWGPLQFVGGQFALMLGTWFVLWAVAVFAYRPWKDGDEGRRFLWCLSVPMFAVFFGFSLKTGGGELNWPVTAYLSGGVLAALWLNERARTGQMNWGLTASVAAACILGLVATTMVYAAPLLHPAMERVVGQPRPGSPYPIRRLDPTCRLRGWRALAAAVDDLREQAGDDPVIVATGWVLPGELGIYCKGRPQVYSIGQLQGERKSQYDVWDNPIDRPEAFKGRSFLVVGAAGPQALSAFERVGPLRMVVVEVNGRPIADYGVWLCRGFRQFPPRPADVRH